MEGRSKGVPETGEKVRQGQCGECLGVDFALLSLHCLEHCLEVSSLVDFGVVAANAVLGKSSLFWHCDCGRSGGPSLSSSHKCMFISDIRKVNEALELLLAM